MSRVWLALLACLLVAASIAAWQVWRPQTRGRAGPADDRRLTPLALAAEQCRLVLAAVLSSDARAATAALRAALAAGEDLPAPQRAGATSLGHLLEGDLEKSAQSLAAALAAHPDDGDLHLLAAFLARTCERFAPRAALAHVDVALRADPDRAGARALRIELAGMLDLARPPLDGRGHQHEETVDVPGAAAAGLAALWRGDYAAALAASDEVVRQGGDVLAEGLAPAFILTGDFQQVRAMDDSEMETQRTSAGNMTALLHAGINEMWAGEPRRAAELFERGAEYAGAPWRRAEAARLLLLSARARRREGRHVEEFSALQAARGVVPGAGAIEHAMATAHLTAGRPREAEAIAAAMDARDPWRLLIDAEAALAAGRAEEARRSAEAAWSAKQLSPADCIVQRADAVFLDTLGRALLASGRRNEARGVFERVAGLGMKGLHHPDLLMEARGRLADLSSGPFEGTQGP